MKTLTITGVTGSLGSALLKAFYGKYKIIGISRNENQQWKLKQIYPKVKYILADVRKVVLPECDYIIHTAAMKHVSSGIDNVLECIDINLNGTINLVKQADKINKKFIYISTDKAVEPINSYGATKFLSEEIVISSNSAKPIFNIVRFGNLFGSSGSIVEILQNENGIHKLTDLKAMRYFITFKQAIKQIKKAMRAPAGTVICEKSKVIKIVDLIKAIRHDAGIEIIGLCPGEKLMERISLNDNGIYDFYTIEEIRELLYE